MTKMANDFMAKILYTKYTNNFPFKAIFKNRNYTAQEFSSSFLDENQLHNPKK